jgi:hypothetical protein
MRRLVFQSQFLRFYRVSRSRAQTNWLVGSLVSVGSLVPVAVEVWSRLLAKGEELLINGTTDEHRDASGAGS